MSRKNAQIVCSKLSQELRRQVWFLEESSKIIQLRTAPFHYKFQALLIFAKLNSIYSVYHVFKKYALYFFATA
ncbi:hypothetical protein P618_200790 [Holospora obtusa F1]|uniref:Uncharacterized protein n=1 Tax=Holospora obtusa F1 TaxID=1399147 RepID=W6TEB3_HOLOB|nr:hypothetical protein P618_200790 [Holospora obtusa F1]